MVVDRPGEQRLNAIRQLLHAGRNEEAIGRLKLLLDCDSNDLSARELMFDAQFQRRSWADALAELEFLRQSKPSSRRYRIYRISTLSNMKRYAEAAAEAKLYLEQHGETLPVLNVLKVAYFNLGNLDDAVRCGQRVLELYDAECWRRYDVAHGTQLKPSAGRAGKNVIAFPLWGNHAAYNYGALINLALAPKYYPGWVCRFYVGPGVPQSTIDGLLRGGAEVVPKTEFEGVPGMYARFLPMCDPTVARFLSRDCDSRLNATEAGLVADWIKTDFPFHVIRDHVLHTEPIMGQLWGGRADCGIDIVALMESLSSNKYGYDQAMLAFKLWPLIRNHSLVHDRFYRLAGVHTVPISCENLGAGYQNLAGIRKEIEKLSIKPIAGLEEGRVWE